MVQGINPGRQLCTSILYAGRSSTFFHKNVLVVSINVIHIRMPHHTLSRAAMFCLRSIHPRKMPQPPIPRRKVSVAIVGAGVAGLRAAEILLNANNQETKGDVEYHVTVFEARNRVGGRVATSDGIEGWSGVGKAVDLGPNWIHGTHENPLVPYLPLTTPPSISFDPYEPGGGILYIPAPGGPEVVPKHVADEILTLVLLACARAEEYSQKFGKSVDGRWSLGDYLGVAAEVKYGVNVPRVWDGGNGGDGEWEKERRRVREFERRFMGEGGDGVVKQKILGDSWSGDSREGEKGGESGDDSTDSTLSPEEKAIVFMQMAELWGAWVGEPLEKQSLRWLIMEEGMEGDQHFLATTYKPILDLLSKPLFSGISSGQAILHLNTQVTHIDLTSDDQSQPQITITTSPTTTPSSSPSTSLHPTALPTETHTSSFSAVLLCLPLGVLKHTHQTLFPSPPSLLSLPPRALSAIENLGYGHLEKVYLRFETAWWPSSAGVISFLEGGDIMLSTNTNPTDINTGIVIPPQTQMVVISLSTLPIPYAQPTLLFYLYGETSVALNRALESLPTPTPPLSTSPSTCNVALPPHSPHFRLLATFFTPYLTRLHHSLSLSPSPSPKTPTLLQPPPTPTPTPAPAPAPTSIIHTTHSLSPFSGYGSYTHFPVGAADSEEDVRVLRELGGKPHSEGGGRGGNEDRDGDGDSGCAAGWDTLPIWLSGEHVAPRKGLATVAGAWWSGGEKGAKIREWFEGVPVTEEK